MRILAMLFVLAALAACDADQHNSKNPENGEVLLNVMQATNSSNLVSVNWPAVDDLNPFSTEPLIYEIWHNEKLLGVAGTNSFQLRLSDLEEKIGCISIRAVRGELKSEHSSPTCFLVQS